MATNEKIKLDITSAFDPGGFSKANRAVHDLGGEMKKSAKVASNLMGAFGEADGAIGNVAGTVSKLGAAFKGGGFYALAAAAIGLIAVKFYEAAASAKKFEEEQQAALKKVWSENLIKRTENSLNMLKSKHAQIADEIERGAKAAEKMAKAVEGLAKSEISVSNAETDRIVALMEGQKQSALVGVDDPVKRKAIELDYERQIFEAKKDAAKFERDQKASLASIKVNDAESALAAEESKIASLKARAKELEVWMSTRTGDSKSRLYGQAKSELDSTRGSIKDAQSSWNEKSIGLSAARNEQVAAAAENQAAMTREAIAQGAIADKMIEFEKAQAEYQSNLDRGLKVQQQISKQEAKLADIKDREMLREERRKEWDNEAQQAKSMGAGAFHRMKESGREADREAGKDTMEEARWVKSARTRMKTLTGKELQRLWDFEKRQDLVNNKNPFDPAEAAKAQKKAIEDNLEQLKKLNTNLENSLKVK